LWNHWNGFWWTAHRFGKFQPTNLIIIILLVKLSGEVFDKLCPLATFCLANKVWWNWPLWSVSSTFYAQLLLQQIPNAQRRQSSQQCLFALLWPTCVKAPKRNVDEITLAGGFEDGDRRFLILLFNVYNLYFARYLFM